MKKAIKWVLLVFAGIIVIYLIDTRGGKTKPGSKVSSENYANKLFTTKEAMGEDLQKLAKELSLNAKDAECLGFFTAYRAKEDTWLIGKTYKIILDTALIFCQNKNSTKADASSSKQPVDAASNWVYDSAVDKMTSKISYYAKLDAVDYLEFGQPYGRVKVNLLIRKKDGQTDALLQISKGQFLSNISNDRTIGIRFDEQKAFNVGYTNPSDYSSESIFINNTKKFIAGLKTAKKTIIQSEFYDEGVRTIEFETAGFKWDN